LAATTGAGRRAAARRAYEEAERCANLTRFVTSRCRSAVCSVIFRAVGVMLAKPSDEVLALGSFSGGGVERCAFGVVGDPVEVRPAAQQVLGGATLPP